MQLQKNTSAEQECISGGGDLKLVHYSNRDSYLFICAAF